MTLKAMICAAATLIASSSFAHATLALPDVITQFDFAGTCAPGDCSGTGHGVLTVKNYTLGQEFTNDNFVEFYYTSNIFPASSPFDITTVTDFSGSIQNNLPNTESVTISNVPMEGTTQYFTSNTDGYWCLGTDGACASDYGLSHLWSAPSVATVPEPVSASILAIGLLGFGATQRRQARLAESHTVTLPN